MSLLTIALAIGVALSIYFIVRVLTTPHRYPSVDLAEIDRAELFRRGEALLREADAWPAELSDGSVVLATSLEPFEVRTVRYQVEVDCDLETAIDYVKNGSDCGPTNRKTEDKFEETLYDKDRGGENHEWVRRSVHISPPPGANRDAVVVYYSDRPDPRTYRIAFQSVDSMDGEPIPVYEGASRFVVKPSICKVQETGGGRVRIRKIEAVDPGGMVSPLLNNYFISPIFFRKYMFNEAQVMRDELAATPKGLV